MDKKCNNCGKIKDIEQFWKTNRNKTDGRLGRCIVCLKEKSKFGTKEYRKKHPGYVKSYNDSHKEEHKKYQRDSLKYRFYVYKSNAKKTKREFSLTLEQFDYLTAMPCFYCNSFSPQKNCCGVDRIDNGIGYTIDNCAPCCSLCNFMKRKLSAKEFLEHIEKIYKNKLVKPI